MNTVSEQDDALLPARRVWERYSISDRTLARWIERDDLKFPSPIEIAGRRYFRISELAAWERKRATAKKEAA